MGKSVTWTDGFNSPPKEGMLWIFSPEKSDGFGRDRTCDVGYQSIIITRDSTVRSECRCKLRVRYVDMIISIDVAVTVCCCFTVFS
jgi:hypothetical protein